MRRYERGDIVMISSVATLNHSGRGGPYNMAKAAMEALALTLSKELRDDGIRVNIVAPGLVETEMGRRLMKARSGVEDLRELDASMPFGRVCQPEDIAGAVRFFVSANSSYVTGEKLNVHGGGPMRVGAGSSNSRRWRASWTYFIVAFLSWILAAISVVVDELGGPMLFAFVTVSVVFLVFGAIEFKKEDLARRANREDDS